MSLYNLEAARNEKQLAQMEDLEARGVCFVCPEHFEKEHGYPIVREWEYWQLSHNDYPYAETDLHLLFFPRQHVRSMAELPKKAQMEYGVVIAEIETSFELGHYAVGMRCGDFCYNGSSVEHLHSHIVVAKRNPLKKVRFKMSRAPAPVAKE